MIFWAGWDEGPKEATKTVRRGRPNPQKPILVSGETQSEWKAKELFGVFEYVEMDHKTQRPIYKVKKYEKHDLFSNVFSVETRQDFRTCN